MIDCSDQEPELVQKLEKKVWSDDQLHERGERVSPQILMPMELPNSSAP